MRVLIASEHNKVQHLLADMVEKEPGAVVVGEADNATKALALANRLRPDVAIIDSSLPYLIGMDEVSGSRASGLDIAQTISGEIPKTRVLLLTNMDTEISPKRGSGPNVVAHFARTNQGEKTFFNLEELYIEIRPAPEPVFAEVLMTQQPSVKKGTGLYEKAIFFGALCVVLGWILMATWISTVVGGVLAVAGLLTVFFSVGGSLFSSLWHRMTT
ncbi:MAG: response regulator [Dehalococcoidia bacterium]|nr:response regulator [Dehalococcoidia bacterium]MDZ4246278.1 response regulator [Dehalococcoidia bacterium]